MSGVLVRPPAAGLALIAVDMDGTLLDPDDGLSPATVAAVARARRAGVAVVPVTGRPDRLVWRLAEQAGLGPLGSCVNGAVLVDLEHHVRLHRAGFDGPDAVAVVDAVRAAVPGVSLGADHDDRFVHEPALFDGLALAERSVRTPVDDLRAMVADGCLKFVARQADLGSEELAALLAPALHGGPASDGPGHPEEELGGTSGGSSLTDGALGILTASDIGWVDIGPAGYTKGTGLLAVCAHLGIDPAATAAIGDHYNDLPLLAAAGRSAAMGNAIPAVLEAADEVAPPNDADGVAWFINGLLDAVGATT